MKVKGTGTTCSCPFLYHPAIVLENPQLKKGKNKRGAPWR
jgi:hypothetical protein